MDFVEAVDYGTAPELHVTGLKSITRISNGIVRVTYYTEFQTNGEMERRVVLHVVWDYEQMLQAATLCQSALMELSERRKTWSSPLVMAMN